VLPNFLVFVPLGHPARLIIAAVAVTFVFCLSNVTAEFEWFDLQSLSFKIVRLLFGFVGVTLSKILLHRRILHN